MEVLDGTAIPFGVRVETILERLDALNPGEAIELITPHAPGKLNRKLMDEYPLRFEVAPLRAGPGQWREHVRARDPEPRSVYAYLAWDHDRVDDLLARARNDVDARRWEDAGERFGAFRLGLLRHVGIEDDILFPSFVGAAAAPDDDPTQSLRDEHTEIKDAIEGMRQAVASHSGDAFEWHYANLLGVMVEHNMKEENDVYPRTDRALNEDARNRLVERMMLV